MTVFLAKRLAVLAITLVVASLIVFFVLEVLPGDPAAIMLGVNVREDTLLELRSRLGLDRPVWERYMEWVFELARGHLGTSYTYSVPVSELIAERVVVSLPLALMAILLSTGIAIPAGILAAAKHNRGVDLGVSAAAQVGIAIPNFWFAILLILVFAVGLRWFPASGFAGWDAGIWPAFKSLLLPAIALALPQAAILTRVTRSSMLEVMGEDYLRTARAKGLSRRAVLLRHALRNALIPVVTIIGLQFSFLLAGTIIVENVFSLPGLGRLLFQAITQRDLIVVRDLVILLAGSVVVVNFCVDMAYAVLDPRLRGASDAI